MADTCVCALGPLYGLGEGRRPVVSVCVPVQSRRAGEPLDGPAAHCDAQRHDGDRIAGLRGVVDGRGATATAIVTATVKRPEGKDDEDEDEDEDEGEGEGRRCPSPPPRARLGRFFLLVPLSSVLSPADYSHLLYEEQSAMQSSLCLALVQLVSLSLAPSPTRPKSAFLIRHRFGADACLPACPPIPPLTRAAAVSTGESAGKGVRAGSRTLVRLGEAPRQCALLCSDFKRVPAPSSPYHLSLFPQPHASPRAVLPTCLWPAARRPPPPSEASSRYWHFGSLAPILPGSTRRRNRQAGRHPRSTQCYQANMEDTRRFIHSKMVTVRHDKRVTHDIRNYC